MNRDLVWSVVLFMREQAKWTGNRFDIELGGIKFSIQRRGRKVRLCDKTTKYSDTYLARGDHGWLFMIRNFNFQNMMPTALSSRPGGPNRDAEKAMFDRSEIDFEGDEEQFGHDYVMMRMFGDW